MHPCSQPPTWSADLSTRRRRYRARYAIAALAVFTFATACATKPAGPPSSGWVSFPLQATSEQPAPRVPPPIPAAQPSPQCVTGPWMEEQLRKFDDRYAGAAADIRAVLEQTLASMKAAATIAELKPIAAGVGKVNADLATLTTRIDGHVTNLQARLKDLERNLADALAARQTTPNPTPAGTASDGLSDAFTAIQATPRQTLPLRAWLESRPNHPKAPEALFQLGMAFVDSGYPSAARHYFTRLIDGYGSSLQAAEAKALLDSPAKPTAKASRRTAPKAAARLSKPACDPKCQAAVPAPPQEIPAAPPAKPAPAASPVSAPRSSGARLVPPPTGLQSQPADAPPPSSSSLSPALKEIK